MSKKYSSADVNHMEFLDEEFVYEVTRQNARVKKMLLKGGFGDWLLVITAKVNGEHMVAFVGAASILGVARKLHQQYANEEIVWKPDQYAK